MRGRLFHRILAPRQMRSCDDDTGELCPLAPHAERGVMLPYALTILIGAFLLFQVWRPLTRHARVWDSVWPVI